MNKAASNKEVRINNQKNIVNTLFRHGPMTKQDLASQLGLSLPTVSVIYKNLLEKGLVAKGEKLESTGGRPPSPIVLVFDAHLSVGIDIASDSVRIILVNLGPEIVCAKKYPLYYEKSQAYWQAVRQLKDDFLSEHQIDQSRLLGIGLAVQAPIKDFQPIAVPYARTRIADMDQGMISAAFGHGVMINNDAKMASLAQLWGAGEEKDLVYVMLSSGVGGAIITDHRLLRGNSRNAEFGHMIIHDGGKLCGCGQRGCLSSYCSSSALREQSGVDLNEFFADLTAGNVIYREIWLEYLENLALAVSNLYLVFDTEIILGGEMSPYIKNSLDEFRVILSRRNPFEGSGNYVRIGNYGEFDSAFGAALVRIDEFLT